MISQELANLSKVQRQQAWEQLRGDMRSMLDLFYSDIYTTEEQYVGLREAIKDFVDKVELGKLCD